MTLHGLHRRCTEAPVDTTAGSPADRSGGDANDAYLQATFGVGLCSYAFPAIVLEALRCGWTNDPFDRLIVAHAIANNGAALITADTGDSEALRRGGMAGVSASRLMLPESTLGFRLLTASMHPEIAR